MKKVLLLGLLSLFGFTLMVTPIQADFIQCIAMVVCDGTPLADVINGTNELDEILGREGDDAIFAGDNPVETLAAVMDNENVGGFMFGVSRAFVVFNAEFIGGGSGNDFLSGGPGPDSIAGGEGNDVILPGPDVPSFGQVVQGLEDNDSVYVFAGEISACLAIHGNTGFDTVNLIGFGPYSATPPFGMEGWVQGWLRVVDPIAGGDVFIEVFENGNDGTEIVNGLLSPNVTLIEGDGPPPAENCELSPIF